ncbi:hypothetical protein TWF281_000391 [Arthrobotrys megalospora]
MNVRAPITRLRLRKSQFRHVRLFSSSTSCSFSEKERGPLIRYLTQRDQVIDPFNYHFTPPENQQSESTAAPKSETNVTTLGESPRFSVTEFGPNYTEHTSKDTNFRMRSLTLNKPPPRTVGSLTGIDLPGVKVFSLPVFEGPSNPIHLNEFLKKYKPSTNFYRGVGPWIFVKEDNSKPGYPHSKSDNYACEIKSRDLLNKTTERVESYDAGLVRNDGQPVSQSLPRHPFLLERVFKSAGDELRQLAVKYNYTCGAWFLHVPENQVDQIFSDLARSLIAGQLRRTAAHAVKVTPSGLPAIPRGIHVICVTIPDAWDRKACKEVLEILVGIHGLTPVGCKPELFVQLGYGHLHRSGIETCTFTPQDFYAKHDLSESRFRAIKGRSFTRSAILEEGPKPGSTGKSEL